MAKVTIGPDWKRVDSDLGLAASTKYRLQFEAKTQIALGGTAPTNDANAITYPACGNAGYPATVPYTQGTGNTARLWARTITVPSTMRAVPAAAIEPF